MDHTADFFPPTNYLSASSVGTNFALKEIIQQSTSPHRLVFAQVI